MNNKIIEKLNEVIKIAENEIEEINKNQQSYSANYSRKKIKNLQKLIKKAQKEIKKLEKGDK